MVAAVAAVGAGVAVLSPASAQAPSQVTLTLPSGKTTRSLSDLKYRPVVSCSAECQVVVTVVVDEANAKLFRFYPRGDKGSGPVEIVRGTASIPAGQSAAVKLDDWARCLGGDCQALVADTAQVPVKKSLPITVTARVESLTDPSFDPEHPPATSTATALKIRVPRDHHGRGRRHGILRIDGPRRVSLRHRSARFSAKLPRNVRSGIINWALVAPGFRRGFAGHVGITRGGRFSTKFRLTRAYRRQLLPYLPIKADVSFFLFRRDGGRPSTDQGHYYVTLTK